MRDQGNQVVMDTKDHDQLQKQEYSSMRSGDDHDDDDHGDHHDQEDCGMLPGFRFHPTDEELVGFYLRRKVEKRPMAFEIIKQIDIYKYDPWDLPKVSSVGDKEWYFFCMRGRKYKNSIRPNRVTGSGFWKATGIDKPIFSVKQPHETIGLKKSLVYYRGTAGKGTKTDWMMHEFRLPPPPSITTTTIEPAAEVWTLCRIFRRVSSYRKYSPAVKGLISTKLTKQNSNINSSSKTCSSSLDSDCSEHCVTFNGIQQYVQNPSSVKPFTIDARINQQSLQHWNSMCYARSHQFPAMNTNYWSFSNTADDLIEEHENWDELRSVVEPALN